MIKTALLRRQMWNGALTNYLRSAVRLLKTIFLTRLLFFHLGEDSYGFWVLLWSIFGYILIFELGFGKTVQKYAAEMVGNGNKERFFAVANAVFSSYLAIGGIIAIATLVLAWLLPELIKLPATGDRHYYQLTLLIFGLGSAMVFPSGIIPEILVGLQRLHHRNWVIILNQLLELGGIYLIFRCGGSLLAIAIFVACNNLFSNFLMWLSLRKLLPDLKLRPTRFDRTVFREISSFSTFIYLMALAKLILQKTDPLVLGAMLGMGAVTVYQLGTRIPEIVKLGTSQFHETLGPAATIYHNSGRAQELQQLLIKSQRLSVYLSIGALAVSLPTIKPVMYLWLHVTDPTVILIAGMMIVNAVVSSLFRDGSREFLQMTGHHKLVSITLIVECIVNLTLSILLVRFIGVIGVVHGTLWPNIAAALLVMLPATVAYSKLSWRIFLQKLYLPSVLAALLPGLLLAWYCCGRAAESWSLIELFTAIGITGLLYLIAGWLFCLEPDERSRAVDFIKRRKNT